MEILPKNLGTRPRLAVELRHEGIVAARAEDAAALLTAVAERALPEGAFVSGLKGGLFQNNALITSSLREALDAAAGSRGERIRYLTLIVPDSSVRVLLLEFDELPAKAAEALPIIRFRLKKLVPFDVENAMVSYQVMSQESGMVRVLAVAMPAEVLAEYESVVSAAGYITGAVLPSTLAALAGAEEQDAPILLVNVSRNGVTTAIVRGGTLLLHRALDLSGEISEPIAVPVLQGPAAVEQLEAEARFESQLIEATAGEQSNAREIVQAISVAVAYFEDTLSMLPDAAIAAGTISAESLRSLLATYDMTGLNVQQALSVEGLAAGVSLRVDRSWLAGVRGALRN
ncbi:MAG: hypothetical protein PW789_12965 [Edaphobacter sp.]|uniref:hypothetical protein n=1 Tax=Edaphobacter sp. TaxID=1934404 RepID=UPI002389C931|nr:hypothetical protein [Edaphobacter sp.]MDE1177495.1 hypothetical protein [Edaphobacter sp.]